MAVGALVERWAGTARLLPSRDSSDVADRLEATGQDRYNGCGGRRLGRLDRGVGGDSTHDPSSLSSRGRNRPEGDAGNQRVAGTQSVAVGFAGQAQDVSQRFAIRPARRRSDRLALAYRHAHSISDSFAVAGGIAESYSSDAAICSAAN